MRKKKFDFQQCDEFVESHIYNRELSTALSPHAPRLQSKNPAPNLYKDGQSARQGVYALWTLTNSENRLAFEESKSLDSSIGSVFSESS